MKINLRDNNWPNKNINYGQLLQSTLMNYKTDLSDVHVKTLSGGMSGAVVFAVYPENSIEEFIIIKTDLTENIIKEITNYTKILSSAGRNKYIAELKYPCTIDECKKYQVIDCENKYYSAVVYSYIGPDVNSNDKFEPLNQWINSILKHNKGNCVNLFGNFLDRLTMTLKSAFYREDQNQTFNKWISDEINIPWNDYNQVMQAYESSNPGWRAFSQGVKNKWVDMSNNASSQISFSSSLCHGDLRCANIIIKIVNGQPTPYIIDFGLVGSNCPLTDFARLEADILLRLVLEQDHSMEILEMLTKETIFPQNSTQEMYPLLQMIYLIRNKAKILLNDEIQWEKLYTAYLIGHSTRMLRWNDPELRGQYKKTQFAWYILMLHGKLFQSILGDPPANIPKPIDSELMLEDMKNSGVVDFFFGERRNKCKKDLICNDQGEVCVLAHTGYSYLHYHEHNDVNGGKFDRFYTDIKTRLEKNGIVKIILLNPYSVEGSKLGIAEARGDLRGPEVDLDYYETQTELFRRFDLCLKGYDKLKHHGNFKLRITHYSPDATILMSNEQAFIEPYLVGQLAWRYHAEMKMNAPELLCIAGTKLYDVAKAQFSFFWNKSITVEEYRSNKVEFKDEFMRSERLRRKMVALHESWFALDPIVGCPNYCSYCFLTPYKINDKKPFIFSESSEAVDKLVESEWINKQQKFLETIDWNDERLPVPVAIGNYTEMLNNSSKYIISNTNEETSNEEELKKILNSYAEKFNKWKKIPILCLITKLVISDEMIKFFYEYLKNHKNIQIAIFTSISFLNVADKLESVVKDHYALLENFRKIKELNQSLMELKIGNFKRRIAGIHFWRPLLKGMNDKELENSLTMVAMSGAVSSVAVGLKISKRLATLIKNDKGFINCLGDPVNFDLPDEFKNGGDYFDHEILNTIKLINSNHPIFLNTSCAISHAFGRPDYNASYVNCQLPVNRDHITRVLTLSGVNRHISVTDNGTSPYIKVDDNDVIEQEAQTFIRQMLGVEVAASVQSTHEWKGAISRLTKGQQCKDSKCPADQKKICEAYYSSRCI
jgi:DNA repair photolyase